MKIKITFILFILFVSLLIFANENTISKVQAKRKIPGPKRNNHTVHNFENPPVILTRVKPVYPDECVKNKIEGEVYLEAAISDSGKVTNVEVSKSSGNKELDNSAIEAVYKWTFKPASDKEKNVPCTVNFPLTFKLEN